MPFPSFRQGRFFCGQDTCHGHEGRERQRTRDNWNVEESVFVELSRQFRPLFHATPFCTVVVHCTALTVLHAS